MNPSNAAPHGDAPGTHSGVSKNPYAEFESIGQLLANLEASNESWRAKTRRSEDLTVPRSHRGDMYLWNLSQQSTAA